MAKIKIQQPKFIDELEEESRIEEYDFDDKIADKLIENQAIRYKDGRGTTLDSCIFRNVVFQECTFKNIDFVDVVFEHCDMSNIEMTDGSIMRAQFIGCKLVGSKFDNNHMKDVLFKDSVCSYANFSYSKLQNVAFEKCRIEEGVFQEVNHKNLGFMENIMNNAYFNKTPLNKIDFTTCEINGLNAEIPDLEGAVVTTMQALDLAQILRLVIK